MENDKIEYSIDSSIIKKYVDSINSIKLPMCKIKEQLSAVSKSMQIATEATNKTME